MPAGPKLPPGGLEAAAAALLREAVERSDLSMTEVARRVPISKSQLSRILAGAKPLTMTEFDRICRVLSLRPASVIRAAAHVIEASEQGNDPPQVV